MINNHWEIPPPGTTCPNCGHDMSSHTGPCVTVETLKNALGEGESRAEATVNGTIMRVEQYINPFGNMTFWLWGYAGNWAEVDGTALELDYREMGDNLFGHGFDPDSLIWQTIAPISL